MTPGAGSRKSTSGLRVAQLYERSGRNRNRQRTVPDTKRSLWKEVFPTERRHNCDTNGKRLKPLHASERDEPPLGEDALLFDTLPIRLLETKWMHTPNLDAASRWSVKFGCYADFRTYLIHWKTHRAEAPDTMNWTECARFYPSPPFPPTFPAPCLYPPSQTPRNFPPHSPSLSSVVSMPLPPVLASRPPVSPQQSAFGAHPHPGGSKYMNPTPNCWPRSDRECDRCFHTPRQKPAKSVPVILIDSLIN